MTKELEKQGQNPKITTEHVTKINGVDMDHLCEATETAIKDGGGFGWVKVPSREVLERYWQGVVLIPHRDLFVGRVDGTIAGAVQLIRQPSNNEAQGFSAKVISVFVAPWARGFHLGQELITITEKFARDKNIEVIRLDVRETQKQAIGLFESCGYKKWGENPLYAKVDDTILKGLYFQKQLSESKK